MSFTYGQIDGALIISTGNTSNIPSDDIIYFYCQSIQGQEAFMQNISVIPGGYSFGSKDGKRSATLQFQNLYVVKWGAISTFTEAFNLIQEALRDWHTLGSDPLYLWLYNRTESAYVNLGWDPTTNTELRYLEGYITAYSWGVQGGNIYILKSMTFKECLD